MGFTLWAMVKAALLCTNALAILNEPRFLTYCAYLRGGRRGSTRALLRERSCAHHVQRFLRALSLPLCGRAPSPPPSSSLPASHKRALSSALPLVLSFALPHPYAVATQLARNAPQGASRTTDRQKARSA